MADRCPRCNARTTRLADNTDLCLMCGVIEWDASLPIDLMDRSNREVGPMVGGTKCANCPNKIQPNNKSGYCTTCWPKWSNKPVIGHPAKAQPIPELRSVAG